MTLDQKIQAMREKIVEQGGGRMDSVETIQAAAIASFGVEKESFFNGDRTRPVAYARMASMSICRLRTRMTMREIATLHGGLDHTAASYAIKTASEYFETIPEFKAGLESIFTLLDGKKEG